MDDSSQPLIQTAVTELEYQSYLAGADLSGFTKSDEEEVKKIEDLLGLRRDVLKGQAYYVGKSVCKCGKQLTFIDFVNTAVKSSAHSAPFLVQALLGNKYGFQTPRSVTCSACGEVHPNAEYKTPNYTCRQR